MTDVCGCTAFVLAEIAEERSRQDAKWGGPDHDDSHSALDFCRFLRDHLRRAENTLFEMSFHPNDTYRQQMVRVAALAVAAVERWDRCQQMERTYDEGT